MNPDMQRLPRTRPTTKKNSRHFAPPPCVLCRCCCGRRRRATRCPTLRPLGTQSVLVSSSTRSCPTLPYSRLLSRCMSRSARPVVAIVCFVFVLSDLRAVAGASCIRTCSPLVRQSLDSGAPLRRLRNAHGSLGRRRQRCCQHLACILVQAVNLFYSNSYAYVAQSACMRHRYVSPAGSSFAAGHHVVRWVSE